MRFSSSKVSYIGATTWHNCFRFLGSDPPKLFSSREQYHFPRTGRSPRARAVDLARRRRAAAATAAADLGLDPDLPAELLPSAWPRAQARELFIGCYDQLGPLAALRVRQIITRYSPELADRAAYHSSELKLSAAPAADA